ncbi:LOW QUALITY PROTEIN: membrane protein [Psychrobacter sp. JCM 18900]|nr:LOW QUALITY PROTEIN: membrane protein [Psychrobacter sp. JCM 18900]
MRFFSSTFILNELMSSAGGHWFWSASLRYVFMLLIITAVITMQHGFGRIKALMKIFLQHWGFWCITDSIGFGLFYTGICYAADHVAGWVVAATFMFTVVASLLVLLAFGQCFDKKNSSYMLSLSLSVWHSSISVEGLHAAAITDTVPMSDMLLYGALPALIAAFSYPIGNQLVWQASHNARQRNTELQKKRRNMLNELTLILTSRVNHSYPKLMIYQLRHMMLPTSIAYFKVTTLRATSSIKNLTTRIPSIETTLLQNAFNKVWLMTLGCLPFWLFLSIIVRPDQPHPSQIINTLLVALLAGVAATTIFLYAREQAVTSSEVAGVDSTQASEVIFALSGGIVLLDNAIPSAMGLVGIGLIIVGLILFAKDG